MVFNNWIYDKAASKWYFVTWLVEGG